MVFLRIYSHGAQRAAQRPNKFGPTIPSPLAAQRVAVLPAGAILAVVLEARRVLALRAGNARAAVRVALAVLQRKSLQIDVRRRTRIALRLRWRGRAIGRRRQARPHRG